MDVVCCVACGVCITVLCGSLLLIFLWQVPCVACVLVVAGVAAGVAAG